MLRLLLLSLLLTSYARGQQSLFNVPSSEITRPGQTFFQEQASFAGSILQSNSTFCYGLGNNMEVGFDVLNVDFNFASGGAFFAINNSDMSRALSPIVVATFQKGFEINEWFRIGLGAQLGANFLGGFAELHPLTFAFVNTVTKLIDDKIRVYLGAFYGNTYYLGRQDHMQFMAGLEIPLLRDELHFVADHLHGHHNLGLTVIGLTYFPQKEFALSAGWQLPNPNSPNDMGAVIELTWM